MAVVSVRVMAPAKLNLFLHIIGRRSDGYHQLQTVFQILDYGDWLEFETTEDGHISIDCPGLEEAAENNLVMRAARALQADSGTQLGAHIHVQKLLPAGGGLGGGSSDAATTLLALNRLWALNYSLSQLANLGLSLGADVPVFIHGHSAWAEGIGEQLQRLNIPQRWYLVITPNCSVSTEEVFSRQELTRNTPPITIPAFFEGGAGNDCEPVVRRLYQDIDKALNWLDNFSQAQLTGTGACIFAAFGSETDARAVLARVPAHWQGFVARGVDHSPAHTALDQDIQRADH